MATTNLQVNAQTSQAVGAFNQLAASIASAQTQWNRLNNTIRQGQTAAQNYSTQLSRNVGQAFSILSNGMERVFDALKLLGVGLGFVFGAVIKELDKLQGFNAIMSVTTASAQDAAKSYDFLRKTADRLGIQFDSLTGNYAKLVAALPEGNDRLKIAEKTFLGISMAARTLHSSNQDIQLMFYAVTQIASKGVVSMEELRRQLGEKLPGALQIAARAFNTTTEKLEAAIRKGVVNSNKFLAGFGDELIRTFGDSSEKASESVSAAINRLTNVWTDFVKYVLDSGAAQAIIGVFDELRKKLSDSYLIARFAELIKSLADQFTNFIENISSEDLKNGFDTFARGIDLGVKLFGKLVELMTWIINNAPKAGAIIGGAFGAAAGAIGGPVGMVLGATGGAALGANIGRELAPSKNDLHRQRTDREYSEEQVRLKRLAQEDLLYTSVIPKLQQFKGLDSSKITNLLKAEMATAKLLEDLGTIQFSKEYKDQKSRNEAVYEYAKTGVVLGPNNRQLSDIIGGNGKGKKTAEEKSMDATWARAVGLDANFFKEWENLNKLYKQHKIDTDQLTDAQAKLLSKQPFMEEAARKNKEAWDAERDSIKEVMRNEMELIQLNDKVTRELDTAQRTAGMRSDELRVESEVMKIQNEYAQKGLQLSDDKLAKIREQITATERIKEVTAAENGIIAQTVDRFRQQIIMAQAIRNLLADPMSGVTKEQIGDNLISQDANLQTGQAYLDQQKRAMEDYYAYINMLRGLDVINDDQALRAKALAQLKYQEIQLQGHKDFFGNLSALQASGSKKIQAIGKAAAITQATIDAYLAINRALATLPPPLSYAVAASIGAAAFVNVQKIASTKSFWTGGYTGDGASTAISGVTHGQEFVVNRDATAKNREVLEAMNRGQTVTGGGGMKVSIENYGTSKVYDVQPLSASEVRIIARDEANTAVATRAPAVIAADLDNPNSKTSKAVSRNVSAPRKR